jgi:hypothetical protein
MTMVTTGDGYCQVSCLICSHGIRENQVTDSWAGKFKITDFFRNFIVLRKALAVLQALVNFAVNFRT